MSESLARGVRPEDHEAPHPLYAVWEITLKCDLGCKHCGSRAGHPREDELSTEECLDVVHQLADMGLREVTLIGGEAYLREDWDVIAAEITKRGMACGITTGARNLDADRIRRAADAGVRSISISLDGLERTHDAQRGADGSFAAAIKAARLVAQTPIRLATNTQINRLSMPELPALAELLADIGSRAWQIQLTVPMGRAADRPQMLLEPFELLSLFPLLVYVKKTKLEPAGIRLFPGNNIGYFGPYESALRDKGDRGAHWGGCPAGKWSIGLEADGNIKACPSLPSHGYGGGSTRDARIADVMDTPELSYLRDRTRRDLWGYCRDCYYADVCKAGCSWTSQVVLGRPGNNPYCIHRAVELERRGRRERIERVAEAPGMPFDQGRFRLIEEPLAPQTAIAYSGHAIERVTSLDWQSGGIWTDAELERLLEPRITRRSRLAVLA